MASLHSDARELVERLKVRPSQDPEVFHLALGLEEQLLERLAHYESVLHAHGVPLPYPISATKQTRGRSSDV